VSATNWIALQGTVNARDVGGVPAADGRMVRSGVLFRSANLQHLTPGDVEHLVVELGIRRVIDLRTDVEVNRDGPGPLHEVSDVVILHLSLYPDQPAADPEATAPDPVVPWRSEKAERARRSAAGHARDGERVAGGDVADGDSSDGDRRGDGDSPVVASYLRYLRRRPDSIVRALRAIAEPDGATLVHCAAGKDRTGVVIALALSVVGVERRLVAEDYARSQSQMTEILAHLARSDLYGPEVTDPASVPPAAAEVMLAVLERIADEFGGIPDWLAQHGWSERDSRQLRDTLLA
jgi:protein tyrosine/serine phosphatase